MKAQPNAPTSGQASPTSLAGDGASAAVLEASPNAIVAVDAELRDPAHRGLRQALLTRWRGKLELASVG